MKGRCALRKRMVPKHARDVLSYFVRNPRAADSLEGVARWRLLEETVHHGVENTRQALDWLVEEGFLREEPVKGAHTVFSLNPERATQAVALLAGSKAPKPRTIRGRR